MSLLLLVDATSLAYRAFFAFEKNPLRNSKGENTSAIFAFTNSFLRLLEEYKPTHAALVFDAKGKTKRHEIYSAYKATRPKAPDELTFSLIWIKELGKALKIKIFEIEGYEADDVIATIAKKAEREGFKVLIQTSDKDILQIVNENIWVLDTRPKEEILYNPQKVKEKYGLPPEKLSDYFTLIGDSIDNIPGVSGIGEKRAKEILEKYSLEEILEEPSRISDKNVVEIIKNNRDIIEVNKKLINLELDVPIYLDMEELKVKEPDLEKLFEIFRMFEFRTLMKKFSTYLPDIKLKEDYEKVNRFPIAVHLRDGYIVGFYEEAFKIKDEDFKDIVINENNEIFVPDAKKFYKRTLKKGIDVRAKVYDPIIIYQLMYPEKPDPDEETITLEFLGKRLSDLPSKREVEILYVIKRIIPKLMEEIFREELDGVYFKIENPLTRVLAEMELSGVLIDRKIFTDLEFDILRKLKLIQEEIFSICGTRFNLNSPFKLRKILFEKLKLKPKKRTKTGYSTDQAVLQELAKEHIVPRKILEYRELFKILSTYVTPLKSLIDPETGRIYATFKQIGTQTGRITCVNPNLQTIPIRSEIGRNIRRAFIAPQGFKIVVADYSQIELRILAHLSGDENMIEAFIKGRDIHAETAKNILGKVSITEEDRRKAKTINFGIFYGLSPYGLSKELSISYEEAEEVIRDYFRAYPKVKEWIDYTIREATEKGEVRTIFGRKRKIFELFHPKREVREQGERMAVNTPVQGSAADIIKLAMINIYKEVIKNSKDIKLVLQLHDELIFEVKEEKVDDFLIVLKNCMEKVYNLKVPLEVKVGVGRNWFDAKRE
ncbi:MAG: DNA polymerase I [candidate division WOR-3 bacterium]